MTNFDVLVSVIIPVYRVADYLEDCVQSVISQTYSNLEIILVDDGSPDECPALCDGLANRDSRSRVIHKQNGGLSDARNVGLAEIEAFGAAPTPFIEFDSSFQRNMGFEPEISLRQVTSAQCPVVEFLARKAGQRSSRPPRLTIKSDRLRSGQELSGSVDAKADANVEVLLVADDGLVHNLGPFSKRSGDTINFNLRVEASSAGEKPQLVVAIASPRPLASLKMSGPANADRFFRQLQDETSRGQVSGVSTRYFKLGG